MSASASDRLLGVGFVVLVGVSLVIVPHGLCGSRSSRRRRNNTPVVEQLQAALDGLESPHYLGLEAHQDLRHVVICAARNLVGFDLSLTHNLVAQLFGLTSQLPLLDQVRRLLLGSTQNLLGFLTSLFEKALNLIGDAPGRLDVLRNGHPELIDPLQRRGLIDYHAAAKGEFPAVGNERLQTLDQNDDVYRSGSPSAGQPACRPRLPRSSGGGAAATG